MRKPICLFAIAMLLASQLTGCVSSTQVDTLNSELTSLQVALTELQAQTKILAFQQQQASLEAQMSQEHPSPTDQSNSKAAPPSLRQVDVAGEKVSLLTTSARGPDGSTIVCSGYVERFEKNAQGSRVSLGKLCSGLPQPRR